MGDQHLFIILTIFLLFIPKSFQLTSVEPDTVTTSEKTTSDDGFQSTEKETVTSTAAWATSTSTKTSSTSTSTSTTAKPSTTSTSTAQPQSATEWQDIEETESIKLVNFVVSEIQKLKVEHKELDECQELDLSSVLSGKKLSGKTVKYSVTLKVQPQVKNTEECLKQNATMNNMHPEICEADVTEGDRGGTNGKTLLRSTCLQVEELQD